MTRCDNTNVFWTGGATMHFNGKPANRVKIVILSCPFDNAQV